MRFRVVLEGGLGNQMFQYAFARSMAEHYGAELYIKTTELSNAVVKREYMLERIFGISADEGSHVNWRSIIAEPHPYVDRCENQYYQGLPDSDYEIRGYWQNEGYFAPYKEIIRKEFNIDSVHLSDRSLIMQVRRTDFVNNPAHFYCDVDWYKNALKEFENFDLFITTDDEEWCKSEFSEWNPKIISGDELYQYQVMKGSLMHIISNSSFGWWGAWMSDTDNVVCPEVWFPGDHRWNTARKKWKKLKK
jgi:hypothetical protein